MKHLSANTCGGVKELWERDVPRAYKLSQEGWGALRKKKKRGKGETMQSKREKAAKERSEANGETRQRGSDNRERRGEMMRRRGGGQTNGGPPRGSKMFFVPVRHRLKIRICVTHLY